MVKIKDMQFFYGEFENGQKDITFFDLPERGFEPQIFSNFYIPISSSNKSGRSSSSWSSSSSEK